jgi:hypothetical protein
MREARSPLWNIQPATRLDRRYPYLLLQQVTLFVSDQERSRRFFVDSLGFSVALGLPLAGIWTLGNGCAAGRDGKNSSRRSQSRFGRICANWQNQTVSISDGKC